MTVSPVQWFNAFSVNAATGAATAPMMVGGEMSIVRVDSSNSIEVSRNGRDYLQTLRREDIPSDIRVSSRENEAVTVIGPKSRHVVVSNAYFPQLQIGFGNPDALISAWLFIHGDMRMYEMSCPSKIQDTYLQRRGLKRPDHFSPEISHGNLALQWKTGLQAKSKEKLFITEANTNSFLVGTQDGEQEIHISNNGLTYCGDDFLPDLLLGLWEYLRVQNEPTRTDASTASSRRDPRLAEATSLFRQWTAEIFQNFVRKTPR